MLILRTLLFGELHGYGIAQFIRQTSQEALLIAADAFIYGRGCVVAGFGNWRGQHGVWW